MNSLVLIIVAWFWFNGYFWVIPINPLIWSFLQILISASFQFIHRMICAFHRKGLLILSTMASSAARFLKSFPIDWTELFRPTFLKTYVKSSPLSILPINVKFISHGGQTSEATWKWESRCSLLISDQTTNWTNSEKVVSWPHFKLLACLVLMFLNLLIEGLPHLFQNIGFGTKILSM